METNTKYYPFTSKGYPFKKDWSSYNTYDMRRELSFQMGL